MTTRDMHSRRLADLLTIDRMGNSERKSAVEKLIPKNLAYNIDGKIWNARELLQTEGNAASGLIPTEVLATVKEGAEPLKCWREILPLYRMTNAVLKVPYGETGSYLTQVAEGMPAPIATETYSVATYTARKYPVLPMVSEEMIADASFDVIAKEVRKSGSKIENTLNRLALDTFFTAGAADAGTYQTDCGGSGGTPLAKLGTAVGTLNGRGFVASDIVMCPALFGTFLNAFTSVATGLGDSVTQSGRIPMLFGCKVSVCGATDTNATYNWAWAANGDFGALVIDRNSFGGLGMREDIYVEDFKDVQKGLRGMKVAARFDVQQELVTAGQYLQF